MMKEFAECKISIKTRRQEAQPQPRFARPQVHARRVPLVAGAGECSAASIPTGFPSGFQGPNQGAGRSRSRGSPARRTMHVGSHPARRSWCWKSPKRSRSAARLAALSAAVASCTPACSSQAAWRQPAPVRALLATKGMSHAAHGCPKLTRPGPDKGTSADARKSGWQSPTRKCPTQQLWECRYKHTYVCTCEAVCAARATASAVQ